MYGGWVGGVSVDVLGLCWVGFGVSGDFGCMCVCVILFCFVVYFGLILRGCGGVFRGVFCILFF